MASWQMRTSYSFPRWVQSQCTIMKRRKRPSGYLPFFVSPLIEEIDRVFPATADPVHRGLLSLARADLVRHAEANPYGSIPRRLPTQTRKTIGAILESLRYLGVRPPKSKEEGEP